jgi:hypothetical protein
VGGKADATWTYHFLAWWTAMAPLEITSILGVPLDTVINRRYRLQSKLGLKQKKLNLCPP